MPGMKTFLNTFCVEFVYSWLGNFAVDEETCEIRICSTEERDPETADYRRMMFLVGIKSQKKSNIWEYQTMLSFLNVSHWQ